MRAPAPASTSAAVGVAAPAASATAARRTGSPELSEAPLQPTATSLEAAPAATPASTGERRSSVCTVPASATARLPSESPEATYTS